MKRARRLLAGSLLSVPVGIAAIGLGLVDRFVGADGHSRTIEGADEAQAIQECIEHH